MDIPTATIQANHSSDGGIVPEIQPLTQSIRDLSQSVDLWNQLMLWGLGFTVVAALFVLVTTRMIVFRTGQLSSKQELLSSAKDRQLTLDLREKDGKIAEASKAVAEAQLELARLKQPRSISPLQQEALIASIKPFAGQNFACAVFPDPESIALIRVLDGLLKSAGWKRVPSQIDRIGGVKVDIGGESSATIFDSGVTAYVATENVESVSAQLALCSALNHAGIHCETHRTPQLSRKTPSAITISVGKKP